MSSALVLTYHAIEPGDGPLVVDPATFAAHLDCIVESGAQAVTVSGLAELLRAGALSRPTVAVTFDDGIASVARVAAPLLAERGIPATVFCVAGHLGGANDWPSALPGGPRFELAAADELAALAAQGFEIGCHGMTHAPLVSGSDAELIDELVASKELLEQVVESPVEAYAYPYGAIPTSAARRLVEATFGSAWTTATGYAELGSDLHAAPRVDAHYLRRTAAFDRALKGGSGSRLLARRLGARARRVARKDYRVPLLRDWPL
ncbi:MAG: polysaccharide deacetylase family protein [Gaiellaceae bacterium MAG52_C11]|nr:polysaccharide deacetylase family protein [Candidatus Gaiellasilicea maunaloa]